MLRVEQIVVGLFVIAKDNATEVTTKAWEDVLHFYRALRSVGMT